MTSASSCSLIVFSLAGDWPAARGIEPSMLEDALSDYARTADVLTTVTGEGGWSSVRGSVAILAADLCRRAEARTTQIADCCVAGNTAMMHLLLQLPVARLLHAPFVAAIDCALELQASEIGISSWPPRCPRGRS